MVYPIIYRVSTIQGGAGYLPSTVDPEASLQCHVWKLRSSKKPFLRSKTPEERPSAQQAVGPVTCRCPGPWHPWHCRRYGTDGSGDAWRTRTWSLCLCGLLRASGCTENGKFCDQNWFPVTALWKRPAGRAVSSSGPGVLFLLTRSSTVFAKFWQLKTHPLKNL